MCPFASPPLQTIAALDSQFVCQLQFKCSNEAVNKSQTTIIQYEIVLATIYGAVWVLKRAA